MESYVVSPFMGGLFNVLLDRLFSPEMKHFLIGRDSTALLIDKLQLQMLAIGAVLYEAEKKRHDNPSANKWLQMLKDAIFDAEDLIDEIHTKALQQKVESEAQSSNITETESSNVTETQSSNMIELLQSALTSLWSKTASLATSLDPFHERIDLKINNLCQMLSDLAQQIHILSLEDNKSDFSLEQLRKKRETTSLIDPSREVIGRREEKRKIVGFLQDKPRFQITQNRHQKEESTAESDVGICVVAIVGMPGIGKTTLAQAVFNNSWVDVPSRSLKTACFNRLSLNYLHVEGEGDSLHFPIRSFPQLNYLDFRSGLLDWNGGYDSCLERLYDLTIYGTLHFPEEGLCARNLTTLVIHGSDSLEALPKRMRSTLTSLRLLSVEECNELVSFPEDGLPTDLTTLAINKCGNLKVLPDRMLSSLTSLQSLSIESCNIHQSFPEGGLPASLRTLCIKDCPRLLMNLNNWPLRSLVSLEHLEIRGVRNVHFFPGRDLLPTTLTHLCLEMFYHLDILNGSELQRSCSQLEELKISNCDTAKFEAKEHGLQEIPPSLCSLEIYRCPLLEKWFRMELKRNPSKISHLCRIKIGGEEF